MPPIRKGDGTTVEPKGIAEVRRGDGTVLYSAGSDIPDSAIHRWILDDVASGTATDSIGTADGTVNGVASTSGTWVGGAAGDSDGVDDFIDTTTLGTYGSEIGGAISYAFTIQKSSAPTSNVAVMGTFGSGAGSLYPFFFPTESSFVHNIIDDGGNFLSVDADWTALFDGNPHRVVVRQSSADGANVDIFYDNVSQSTTIRNDDIASTFSNFANDWYLFARNNAGSADLYLDAILDDIILFNDELTDQEIAEDYNRQPWS